MRIDENATADKRQKSVCVLKINKNVVVMLHFAQLVFSKLIINCTYVNRGTRKTLFMVHFWLHIEFFPEVPSVLLWEGISFVLPVFPCFGKGSPSFCQCFPALGRDLLRFASVSLLWEGISFVLPVFPCFALFFK